MMKKLFGSTRVVFTLLQVCSLIALIAAVWELTESSCDLAFLRRVLDGLAVPTLVLRLLETALWCVMWASFLLMCGRLKREPSAFTARNARTLLIIAVCCGVTGALLAAEAVIAGTSPVRGLILGGWFGSIGGVVVFFGMMTVALVLWHLLKSAMALQEDNDLTI